MPDSAGAPAPAPSPSRVRDALLGGRRNLQADRDLADLLEMRFPGTARGAAEARAFTVRAVTWCARQGIGQYIVPEPGLPLPGAGEAARAVIPGARIAYAVTDSSEVPYGRAAAAADDVTAVVRDIGAQDPAVLLADPELKAVIDLGQPAAVVLAMSVHFLPAEQASAMVTGFAAALAPGSALIMSAWLPHPGPGAEQFTVACAPAAVLFGHTAAAVEGWLRGPGLTLVDPPGLTDVRWWRAGMTEAGSRPRPVAMIAGAVARTG
jgi:hypothetical protein